MQSAVKTCWKKADIPTRNELHRISNDDKKVVDVRYIMLNNVRTIPTSFPRQCLKNGFPPSSCMQRKTSYRVH